MIKICALVDPMATRMQDQDAEYADIKETFCDRLELSQDEVVLVTDVHPHKLRGMFTDVYVIDYGGMMPGCDDLVAGIFRSLIEQVEEKPNTLFIIWSTFSSRWYQDIVEEENPELLVAPNVVFAMSDDGWDKIEKWFK
jgi:hypothetical protein